MQIDDLIQILREEFALDVPQARQCHEDWCRDPASGVEQARFVTDFLQRSVHATSVLGMQGFGAFLQQIEDMVAIQCAAPEPSVLRWLCGWLDAAESYLAQPATPAAIHAVTSFLHACPMGVDAQAVELVGQLLTMPPALPGEESVYQAETATEADVSLLLDDVDHSLLEALLTDAGDQLERLAAMVEKLAQGQLPVEQVIEAQRIAHTFKGSGNIVGLPGIGRVSHRAEDLLEFMHEQLSSGNPVPDTMVRDLGMAVGLLQDMVAYLQGADEMPAHAKEILQRLMDWHLAIKQGMGAQMELPPLEFFQTGAPHVGWVQSPVEPSEPIQEPSARSTATTIQPATAQTNTQPAAAHAEVASLRVASDTLNRLLRRAGQSITQSERLAQLLKNSATHLESLESQHTALRAKLNQLESIVGRQVVQLREQEQSGAGLDPLEMDRYDGIYGLARAITEAVQDELELAQQARAEAQRALSIVMDQSRHQKDQHQDLLDSRLVNVKTIGTRMKRNVAQTAASTGKQVQLEIVGENVSLDSDVLNRLTEPLLHMLRNAVDHGIETPENRQYSGKPAVGRITLIFRREGNEVVVECVDDGQGLNLPLIREKAIEYGLIAPDAQLDEHQMRRLILKPGFSTKGQISEISGRGIGMDVVNDRVSALKGHLDIESEQGYGTTVRLVVPATSGVAHALVVQCAGEWVALSADQVITALSVGMADRQGHELNYNGVECHIHSLGQWLGFEDGDAPLDDTKPLILARGIKGPVALQVDAVLESRQLILQDAGKLTRRIAGVVACALRGDGRPLFLLDVPELERSAQAAGQQLRSSAALRKRMQVRRTRVLVVDDALSVRRSMKQLLEDAGYEVDVAEDGYVAIDRIRANAPAVVLTDLEMPNLNGLDLTRRLREVPQWQNLPVVMITSRTSDKHVELAREAGVDEYITKPYQDQQLIDRVRRLSTLAAAGSPSA